MCRRVLAAAAAAPALTLGESGPAPFTGLVRALREADQAVAGALGADRRYRVFADIGGSGLLALLATPAVTAFAESLLTPLLDHDASHRGDLRRSMQTWLDHDGEWDAAASALGVHRLRRVEVLLDRDLSVTAVRTEF